MSDYYNILTNLGRSKITDLITSDTALENIQIAFGDGNGSVPTPNPARTALVNEVHRRPANKLQKHPTLTNSIIVDVVIPNNVGGFWIREFGIYFDGVLICNGSLAPTFKEVSDDTVNTYRLKPYINVESDRLKVVEIESDLINATESWTQENFINRSEIVDNLTTNDANKVASARTVKELEDNKLEATDLKDATTNQKGIIQVATSLEVVGFEVDNKAITPSSLGEILLPHGAEPIDVTASRLNNTVYTNPYDRILHVSICWATWQQVNQAFINSKFWGQSIPVNSNSIQSWIYIPVPPRGEYKISLGAAGSFSKWSEL